MLLRAVLWDGLILLFSIISYIQTSQCAHHSNDRDSVLRRRAIPAAAAAANQSTAYSSNDCTSTTSATTYTLFTPSASARPTPITSQFQVVTSYVSEFVLCPLTSTRSGPSPQIQTAPGTQTFSNTSLIQCSTFYSPTVTPICHSTLIVPGGFPLVVTECEQNITFSTRDGYASVSDSGQKVVTRFVAPWEALTTGVPQGLVEVNVCEDNKESEDGGCATRYESWSVGLNNMLETVTNMVDFSTVINGPSEIIYANTTLSIPQSMTSTVSISSTYELVQTTSTEVIVTQPVTSDEPETTTTVFSTVTLTTTITLATGTRASSSSIGTSETPG